MFQFCKVTFRLLPVCLLPAMLLFVSACSKSEDPILKINETTVDPVSDPEAVNRLLQVQGSYAENTPLPAKSPKIDTTLGKYETSKPFIFKPTGIDTIEIGNETNSYFPIRYTKNTFCEFFKLESIYLKVRGAKGRWKIPVITDPSDSLISSCFAGIASLAVPALVQEGDFMLTLCAEIKCDNPLCALSAFNNKKLITDTINMLLSVRKPLPCGSDSVFGRTGLSIRKYDLGENARAGKVKVRFKTFAIPDRIEVRYDNKYVISSCSQIPPINQFPSCTRPCFPKLLDWYTYEFQYDPSKGRYIEVLVRGSCDDSNTGWRLQVGCPE